MNFGSWFPLHDASAVAPDFPGVLQARADATLPYPRGKSAMILYATSGPGQVLRQHVAGAGAAGLGRAEKFGARWVRFGASATPDRDFNRLIASFVDRFGAPPRANCDDKDDN